MSFSLTNTIIPTTLVAASASGPYGGTAALSATLTTTGGAGVAGQTIAFTLNGTPAGTAVTDGSGVATLGNVSLAGIAAGSYPTGVGAAFAGTAQFQASTASAPLTVAQATQTITLIPDPLPDRTFGEASFDVIATATSGLSVALAADRELQHRRRHRHPDRRGELHHHRPPAGRCQLPARARRRPAPSLSPPR